MLKKSAFIIFIFTTSFCFSQENINNSFNISMTLEPTLIDGSIPRGISLNYSKIFKPYFSLGISGRIINQDYTSLYLVSSYIQHLGNSFSIPLTAGAGLKIKDFELSESNNEGLRSFLYFQTGLNWYFSTNWSYTFNITYDYDIWDGNYNTFFIKLGMTYLF